MVGVEKVTDDDEVAFLDSLADDPAAFDRYMAKLRYVAISGWYPWAPRRVTDARKP